MCTEYYTVWNLRKRALLVLFERASDPQAAFVAEMRFGKHAIARSPKSYWSWAHRKWLLSDALKHVNCKQQRRARIDHAPLDNQKMRLM